MLTSSTRKKGRTKVKSKAGAPTKSAPCDAGAIQCTDNAIGDFRTRLANVGNVIVELAEQISAQPRPSHEEFDRLRDAIREDVRTWREYKIHLDWLVNRRARMVEPKAKRGAA